MRRCDRRRSAMDQERAGRLAAAGAIHQRALALLGLGGAANDGRLGSASRSADPTLIGRRILRLRSGWSHEINAGFHRFHWEPVRCALQRETAPIDQLLRVLRGKKFNKKKQKNETQIITARSQFDADPGCHCRLVRNGRKKKSLIFSWVARTLWKNTHTHTKPIDLVGSYWSTWLAGAGVRLATERARQTAGRHGTIEIWNVERAGAEAFASDGAVLVLALDVHLEVEVGGRSERAQRARERDGLAPWTGGVGVARIGAGHADRRRRRRRRRFGVHRLRFAHCRTSFQEKKSSWSTRHSITDRGIRHLEKTARWTAPSKTQSDPKTELNKCSHIYRIPLRHHSRKDEELIQSWRVKQQVLI